MDYTPDYNDLHSAYEYEQERKLAKYPKCDYCGEPITDDYCYDIAGDIICENCLNEHHRKPIEEYMED